MGVYYGIDKGKKTLKVSVFLLIFSWFKGGEREAGPTASRLLVYWVCL